MDRSRAIDRQPFAQAQQRTRFATGICVLLLCVGASAPLRAQAGDDAEDDWRMPGIELLGVQVPPTPQAREEAVREDWRYELYALARFVVIGKRACSVYQPTQVQAAFERVVMESAQVIPPAQWSLLEAAILAATPPEPMPQRFCENMVDSWQGFDRQVAYMQRSYRESAQMRALVRAGALRRQDRPSIGARLSGPPIVMDLLTNSPAEQAGMRLGDTVLEIDGQPVATADGVQLAILASTPGQCVDVLISRLHGGPNRGVHTEHLAVRPRPHAVVATGKPQAQWHGNRMDIPDDHGAADARRAANPPCN